MEISTAVCSPNKEETVLGQHMPYSIESSSESIPYQSIFAVIEVKGDNQTTKTTYECALLRNNYHLQPQTFFISIDNSHVVFSFFANAHHVSKARVGH
jgi:hypothetical protein